MYFKSCLFVSLLIIASSQGRQIQLSKHNSTHPFGRETIQEFCRENGGSEEAAQQFIVALDDMKKCAFNLIEPSINSEFNMNVALDGVCSKKDSLKTCLHPFLNAALKCFTSKGRAETPAEHKGLDALIDFLCRKEDGKYIAIEFASKGRECYMNKSSEINMCIPETDASLELSEEEECQELASVEQCVLPPLRTCQTPFAAHFYEELFKELKHSLSCKFVKLDIGNTIADKTEN